MAALRTLRRWMTAQAAAAGRGIAPAMPMGVLAGLEWVMGIAGPRLPMLARLVEVNMRAAGVYSPEAYRTYFEHVALHLANVARIFRLRGTQGAVARLSEEQIDLDDSLDVLRTAREAGRGVMLVPAHTVNFVLTPARLNQVVPLHVFLRWSADVRKLRFKRQWCEAVGSKVILEPASSLSASSRAAACVEAMREGAVVVITPDVAQKSTEGAPVEVFGRRMFLPTGAAAIAQLAGSPMVPMFGRLEGRRQIVYCRPAIEVEPVGRAEGGRKESLRRAMQEWASGLEAFVRESPAAWFMWGDSRWTRVFSCDPKYATRMAEDAGRDAPRASEAVGP